MLFFNMCDMYVVNYSFMHRVTAQSQKPSLVLLLNSPRAYTDYSKNYHRIIPPNVKLDDINHNSFLNNNSISVETVKKKIIELKFK